MNALDTARYAQADLSRAVDTIFRHKLPLDGPGAIECERLMREYGDGNRDMWNEGNYFIEMTWIAQSIVERIRELEAGKQ